VGEEMALAICRRFKLSNDETDHITWLVRAHMRFRDVRKMRIATLKRLFAEPLIDDLAQLIRADILGSHGDLSDYNWALERKREFESSGEKVKPLLTGDDLQALGLTPGPRFKVILDSLLDAQLEGKVTNRDEAEKFVKDMIAD
jgi:poly(A) polymerase